MTADAGTLDLIAALGQLGLGGGVILGIGTAVWFLRQRSSLNGATHSLMKLTEKYVGAAEQQVERMERLMEMEVQQSKLLNEMSRIQERIVLQQQHTVDTMRDLASEILRALGQWGRG